MTQMPWKQVAIDVRAAVARDNLVLLAGGVAFFTMLAIVPAIAAVVAAWGLFAQPEDVARVVDGLAAALPDSARATIEEQLEAAVGASSTGLGLTALVALVLALWSASSATKFVFQAVATVYGETTAGAYVRFRGLALAFTLGAIVFGLLTVALIALLPAALASLQLGDAARYVANWVRWPLLALVMMGALALVYQIAPREHQRWSFASIGAVIATLLWLLGSAGFAWYAASFGNLNRTYGSMAGVIVLMLWFFLSAFVVVLGAEINVAVERSADHSAPDDRNGELPSRW